MYISSYLSRYLSFYIILVKFSGVGDIAVDIMHIIYFLLLS